MHVPPKIGPLPTWAWGLVILGGLGLGLYLRRHSASSPTASLVSAGGPVPSLGAAGGASDGGGTSGVSTGMDPILAGLLSDSNSALVNESGIFAGLAAQSVQGALDASGAVLSTGQDLISKAYSSQPVTFVMGSSPAGASPAGTTAPYATPTVVPTAPYAPAAPAAPRVGTAGVVSAAGATGVLTDSSGHVVNAKGARVGGATFVG